MTKEVLCIYDGLQKDDKPIKYHQNKLFTATRLNIPSEYRIETWEILQKGGKGRVVPLKKGFIIKVLRGSNLISTSNKYFAVTPEKDKDCSFYPWDLELGETVMRFGNENDVLAMALSYDDNRIASGYFDGSIRIWEVSSGKLLTNITGHSATIVNLSWSPVRKK